MVTVSSHILDSVAGTHAAGIRCQLFRLGAGRSPVFDVNADGEGRFAESVSLDGEEQFELVIHAADYFAARGIEPPKTVTTVVLRFTIDAETRRCHLPVMLAPHSYSTWWSD